MSRPNPPKLSEIALWWIDESHVSHRLKSHYIGKGEPFCFRCGWLAPTRDRGPVENRWDRALGYLERAHLVDFSALRDDDRLDEDGVQNQVPLCHWCHREMPPFLIGQREEALEWVLSGQPVSVLRQLASDEIKPNGDKPRHAARVDRVLADALLAVKQS